MNWQGAVERTVTGMGYELADLDRSAGGLLRVFIDKAGPEPITVDDCERVTRQLQHVLEVEGCAYQRLEVSSPGLDRPLKKPEHYARFAGEQIELVLKAAFQGRKRFQGMLQARGDGWRLVFKDGAAEKALDFAFSEVREARLVPVLDFKGKRFAERAEAAPQVTPPAQAEPGEASDGGRIQ